MDEREENGHSKITLRALAFRARSVSLREAALFNLDSDKTHDAITRLEPKKWLTKCNYCPVQPPTFPQCNEAQNVAGWYTDTRQVQNVHKDRLAQGCTQASATVAIR